MAKFFIDRPIFAWVIALFILVLGGVRDHAAADRAVPDRRAAVDRRHRDLSRRLGADARGQRHQRHRAGDERLARPDLHGVDQRRPTAPAQITLTFEPGTNPDLAQVDVQNRLSRADAAPAGGGDAAGRARRQGALATSCCSRSCRPTTRRFDPIALGDYASRNVLPEIQRMPGRRPGAAVRHRARDAHLDRPGQAGRLQPVADRRQRRDPRAERAGRRRARIGDLPIVAGPARSRPPSSSTASSTSVEQFGDIVLRANTDGSTVRLRDVARIELGGQNYATSARLNGKPVDRHRRAALADRQRARHRRR